MASPGGDRPLRILFIGKRFYTNKDALAERFGRIYRLPLNWSRMGKQVRLWLIDYHTRTVCRSVDGGLPVVSTPALGLASVAEAGSAWMRPRPDVVVASGDCYIGLLGWIVARSCAARFVFDVYDKYDAFAGYRRPLGIDLFRFLRKRADLLLFASRALAAAYAREQPGRRMALVGNGVDAEAFRPMDRQQCRQALELAAEKKYVGYFGSMESQRGVADLVEAVRLLHAKDPGVLLLICGAPHPDTELDFPWVVYRGPVAHAQVPQYMNACEVLALPFRRDAIMDASASCKIAEYLMCRRPIVSSRSPNFIDNFAGQASALGAALCECGNPADLARALAGQLTAPVIVAPPRDLGWDEIAGAALGAIASL